MRQADVDAIAELVYTIYDSDQRASCLDLLHELLGQDYHHSHQSVVFTLQALQDPRSIPFLRQALGRPLDYLDYNASDSEVIAKWFSHALFSIGTPEALQVLREFADSPDPGIRKEMRYRLRKWVVRS